MEMDNDYLRSICSKVYDDVYKISCEIDNESSYNCQQEILAMIESSVEKYAIEKRQYRDRLKHQCEGISEELVKKSRLVGEPLNFEFAQCISLESTIQDTAQWLVPPYKPLMDHLMLELEQLNSKVSERSQQRNKMWSQICTLCDKLALPIPLMPDSLAKVDLMVYEEKLTSLNDEYELRYQKAKEAQLKMKEMYEYIGTPSDEINIPSVTRDTIIDNNFIQELDKKVENLSTEYSERRALVSHLESRITSLASALETADVMPTNVNGNGSDDRIKALELRLTELKVLKSEKIDLFVENSLIQIRKAWNDLYLDKSLRKNFEGKPASEELLSEIEDEIQNLNHMMTDPQRQYAMSILSKYEEIRSNQAELEKMSRDPGRLARRGFAASLRREEKLRGFNERNKPQVLACLQQLNKKWAGDHNGETFYIDGKSLTDILNEERTANSTRRRISLARKRPQSAEHADVNKRARIPRPAVNRSVRPIMSTPQLQKPEGNLKSRNTNLGVDREIHGSGTNLRHPRVPISQSTGKVTPSSTTSLTQNHPRRHLPISRPVAAPQRQPLRLDSSKINLPTSTPGKRFINTGKQVQTHNALQRRLLNNKEDTLHHMSNTPVLNSAKPKWETEEYHKMQEMEISYFDETSIQETPRVRQSFDYDRDAF